MAVLQIGSIIRRRREELGLTQEELADGICSVPTLSRIENGERIPVKENLEILLQRIGYSDMFVDLWTDEQDFRLHQLKFQIRQAVILNQIKEAGELLSQYACLYDRKSAVSHQFYLLYANILRRESVPWGEQKCRLEEALRLTCPKYQEQRFPRVLSYEEIILINNIAICHARMNERAYAIKLLYQLKEYYDSCVVSFEEMLRTKPMVLYNLSKYLGLERRYDECIAVCDAGISLAQSTGRCTALGDTLYNRAWALIKRCGPGDQGEAQKNLNQALQMAEIMGKPDLAADCLRLQESCVDQSSL